MDNNFAAEEFTFYKEILKEFPGEKTIKSSTDADVLCPVHGDRNPSLGIDLRRNGVGPKIVLNCRSAGCEYDEILQAVGLSSADLKFNTNGTADGSNHPKFEGCTINAYAASKNLPVEFLTGGEVGLEETTYAGVPALYIPYADQDGDVVAERFRVGLNKSRGRPDDRFRWKKGAKPTLYGLHSIEEAKEAGYVLLVEGESDCHVAWYYEKPTVGVPGAKNWKDEWAEHLNGIPKILVCVEPDAAGEKLWKTISNCAILEGRLRKVVLR